MRILTLGSDNAHPLTTAALAVVAELEWVEHVDHLTANDEREFLRKARSPEYRAHVESLKPDLIISAGFPRFASAMRDFGRPIIALDMSEFRKMDGALSCLSLRF